MTADGERARQWVHAGSGLFALLLRFLTWPQAAALALVALAFNVLVLPRIGGRQLYRPADEARGYPLGIVLYPIAVLLLIVIFRARLDIAAAAWGVLAFGDGAATLVGTAAGQRRDEVATDAVAGGSYVPRWFSHGVARRLGGGAPRLANDDARRSSHDAMRRVGRAAPLTWNPRKTYAGTAAFAVFGGIGAIALAWWVRPAVVAPVPLTFVVAAPIAAAIVAAAVESVPIRLDDNISVPIAAAAVLWMASLMSREAVAASRAAVLAALPWAIAVNGVTAWLGYRARTVTWSGTVGGAIVGVVIFAAGGWRGWLLLFLAFLVASVASRFGLKRKVLLGIAEERGGRRGAGNAFANCGVAVVAAIAAVTTPYRVEAWLAFAAALTAGGSDTVASEIGKAWGRSTFLVTTLRRVKPGTPGAISLEGTAAGIVAALALGVAAAALAVINGSLILAVVVGATAGAFVESVLGATLEDAGILNNDVLNFINTAVAALVAVALS